MITKEMVKEAEAIRDAASDRLRELRTNYAMQQCPFEIGQEVDVCGFVHRGKKIIIDRITLPSYRGEWMVHGFILLRGGGQSKRRASFDQVDYKLEQTK